MFLMGFIAGAATAVAVINAGVWFLDSVPVEVEVSPDVEYRYDSDNYLDERV